MLVDESALVFLLGIQHSTDYQDFGYACLGFLRGFTSGSRANLISSVANYWRIF